MQLDDELMFFTSANMLVPCLKVWTVDIKNVSITSTFVISVIVRRHTTGRRINLFLLVIWVKVLTVDFKSVSITYVFVYVYDYVFNVSKSNDSVFQMTIKNIFYLCLEEDSVLTYLACSGAH